MPSQDNSDFILLSDLIKILEDKDYYRTYAKSLALTENSSCPLPNEDRLVEEMFHYFIKNNELVVYYNGHAASAEDALKSEVHVKVRDLKKLYANKCIVFPSSILRNQS